ncbi:protein phosphatase [Actinomadura craniellae]|uniref:protein-serine/threonine phosphatase n=1 Tax=Actinomadura craniellae TaxID=2231787 RepID=A0A365HAS6_9ACTN|nr:SpoIIE family protein phosphatase [Actinomadura craniellae]RAY16129.1 protein phosphatase [Actinomadura craniellae]
MEAAGWPFPATVVLGPEGRVTGWSSGAERLLGLPAGQALGRDVRDLLDHPALEQGLALATTGGTWHDTCPAGVRLVCEPLLRDGRVSVLLTMIPGIPGGLELLNEAADRIGSTLDLGRTAREIVEVAVPRFADAGGVYVLERLLADEDSPRREADGRIVVRRLAIVLAADDPDDWSDVFPVDEVIVHPAGSPYAECVATGHPVLCTGADVGDLITHRTGRHLAEVRDHASLLTVPLTARGRTLGFALFSRKRPRPPFAPADTRLAVELAGRAAVCVDNARLYRREHRTAVTLRASLLPAQITVPDALEVAHRYLPADDVTEVGGDWYDVVPLPGGDVALVIGDAMGHGVTAAAAMGQLRVAAHTLAGLDLPPHEVLTRLDKIAQGLTAAQFATCLYVVCSPTTRRCRISGAGHPPPLLALPDGTTRVLDHPPGLPLGVGDTGVGTGYETTELEIPPGATLVLYTDGLIESRRHDLETGIAALRESLTPHRGCLESAADAVLDTLRHRRGDDDISLLLARPAAPDPDRPAITPCA